MSSSSSSSEPAAAAPAPAADDTATAAAALPTAAEATEAPPPGPAIPEGATAAELKVIANQAFGQGALQHAIVLYSRALEVANAEASPDRELLGVLYSNRSITHFQAGDYQQAVNDASAALVERPRWVKAFHRKALSVAALGDFHQATDLYKEALLLEPGNKWLDEKLRQMQKQKEDTPLRDEADWARRYQDLSPQPIRMATLVHFWNICTKKERYAALARLSELANYRFALNEEAMAELPLERYQDIVIPTNWLDFFRGISSARKVDVLESMWDNATSTEKQLIMHDLMYYFKDSAAGDPGNDSGDEDDAPEHGHSHAHSHAHSHGAAGTDADGHVEGCPHHSHAHAHAHAHGAATASGAGAMGVAGGDVIMDTDHEVRQAMEALGDDAAATAAASE